MHHVTFLPSSHRTDIVNNISNSGSGDPLSCRCPSFHPVSNVHILYSAGVCVLCACHTYLFVICGCDTHTMRFAAIIIVIIIIRRRTLFAKPLSRMMPRMGGWLCWADSVRTFSGAVLPACFALQTTCRLVAALVLCVCMCVCIYVKCCGASIARRRRSRSARSAFPAYVCEALRLHVCVHVCLSKHQLEFVSCRVCVCAASRVPVAKMGQTSA